MIPPLHVHYWIGRYFSNQYSPSVTVPLVPLFMSLKPLPLRVPRMPLNFPVPPVSATTLVKLVRRHVAHLHQVGLRELGSAGRRLEGVLVLLLRERLS